MGVFRLALGLGLAFGLACAFVTCRNCGRARGADCSGSSQDCPLRRWLAIGLLANWGLGLPHLLAVLGSGDKAFWRFQRPRHHSWHKLFGAKPNLGHHINTMAWQGVRGSLSVPRGTLPCDPSKPTVQFQCDADDDVPSHRCRALWALGPASMVLTAFHCWWWQHGMWLLFNGTSDNHCLHFWVCLSFVVFWPLAMLGQYARSHRERDQMMKGVAASILIKSASSPSQLHVQSHAIDSDHDIEAGERAISCPDLLNM